MLKPQQLHIPFVGALNEAVDEKVAPEGVLAVAKNVRLDRAGRIVKRAPFQYLDQSDVTEATGIYSSAGSLVVTGPAMQHRSRISDNQPSSRWVPLGFTPTMHAERDFAPTDADPVHWDSAEWWENDYGFGVVAYYEANNETVVSYVVYDAQTGDLLGSGSLDTNVDSFGGVRVVAASDGIYIVHANDGGGGTGYDFRAAYLPSSSGYLGVIAPSTTLNDGSGTKAAATDMYRWDVCATGGSFVLAYAVHGSATIHFATWAYSSGFSNTLNTDEAVTTAALNVALCRGPDASVAWVAKRETTANNLQVAKLTITTLTTGGYQTMRSGCDDVFKLGGCHLSSEKTFWCWTEQEGSDGTISNQSKMRWSEVDTSGGGSATGPWVRPNMQPLSRPFFLVGAAHVHVRRRNVLRGAISGVTTYFASVAANLCSDMLLSFPTSETVDYDQVNANECYCSAQLTTGVASYAQNRVANSTPAPDGSFRWHGYDLSIGFLKYDSQTKVNTSGNGANVISFEGNMTRWVVDVGLVHAVEFSGLTAVCDGNVKVVDPQSSRELVVAHPPRIFAMKEGTFGGSMASSKDYQFVAVWEWYSNGIRYQSEPSVPETISLSASGGSVYVDVEMPGIGTIAHDAAATVVLYRTEGDGGGSGIFYRLRNTASSEGYTETDTGVCYVELFVSEADADVVGNEVLYTASALANNQVPGGSASAEHKSRLWIGGGLDPYRIYYSHPGQQGLPPRFNLAMYMDIPTENRVTAVASAGDILAVFTENEIFAVLGDGPNTLGAPLEAFRVQLVSSGIGAVSQASVVETPDGVMFVSSVGIRLLTQSLQVMPIGEQVQGLWEEGVCVGAYYSSSSETTHFAMAADSLFILVFDHLHKVWTSDYPAVFGGALVGACAHAGELVLVSDAGVPYIQDADAVTWQDTRPGSSSQFFMDLETAWLKMGEMMGFKRLRWVHLLGEVVGAHGIQLDVTSGYTDGSSKKTTHSWSSADIAGLDHLELAAHLKYQRGAAFKVRALELAGATPTEGFQANALGLSFGIRGTLTKMRTEATK